MATMLRLSVLVVTVLIPGGFLLIPLYLAVRARRSPGALDFEDERRRVPQTRPPPPEASRWRRRLRKLSAPGGAVRLSYR